MKTTAFTNEAGTIHTTTTPSASPVLVAEDTQPVVPTDIAVVGRAVRVPGAQTVEEFWDNLQRGVESIRKLTDDELRAAGVDAALLSDPAYIKVAAPLAGIDQFDAGFFGFSPREAAIMDPQHRHFLEVAWEALEDSGHVPENFSGRIGIFAGSGMNAYMPYHLFTNPKLMSATGLFLVRHTGNDKDFLTTRVSYLFDLRGPSVNIQTACSTSLVAIHAACQSLINQECDMALAGGVTIEMPHGHGYLYQEGEILSDDGHCRAFDRRAKGTVFGSGAGLVVLRRLEDALADGDTVYAVVKASAVNNDGGRKVGYLAPSVDGQAEAVAEALNLSGVPADSISYIECHGTGTPVGDPIEVAGLTHAFRSLTDARGFCALGSVKTNIGHLDTAAGVAGFVKVMEMLRHRTLVPSLHFREPNPEVDWANTPFFVNNQTTPWLADGPLRASVNSLGVGGTNAHVVLEEAPDPRGGVASDDGTLFLLSARTKASLDRATSRLADHLERHDDAVVNDVAFTLATGRRRFSERRAVVASSRKDAIAALRPGSQKRWLGASGAQRAARVAFLFPGGGAQYPGMAADLYEAESVFRGRVDTCLEILRTHERIDLRPVLFPPAGTESAAATELVRPSLALPALLTVELAVAELLRSWGITPTAMLGHSMGEYAAAFLAGVFSLPDVLAVVCCRGRLFETLPAGAMLSVPLPESEVVPELLPGLSFAASNGPGLSLVSGEVGAIGELESRFRALGVEARRLQITVAAHSQMLDPILGEFETYLQSLHFGEPTVPFVSNVTGTWITPTEARDPRYWVRHLRQPVRFAEGLSTLFSERDYAFVEVGPGRTLTSLAQSHPAMAAGRTVTQSLRHPQDPTSDREALLSAVGKLWTAGIEPNWKAFFGSGRRRVSLPTYSFDHERHWIEPGQGFFMRAEASRALGKQNDRAQWTYRQIWRQSDRGETKLDAGRHILVFADEAGIGREVVLELRAAGHVLTVVTPGESFTRVNDSTFRLRSASREDHATLLRELSAAGRTPTQIVHLWAVDDTSELHAKNGAGHQYLFPLVTLAQALVDEEPSNPLEIVVVTNGADAVGAEVSPRFPLKAVTQGPVRVVPKEMPSVSCRSIDLPGVIDSVQAAARSLVAELDARTSDLRVALRDECRFVEAYERWPLPDVNGSWQLRQRGVVLITGGLGGIALALAERLAKTARARLVLLSRSALPPREEWPALLSELEVGDPLRARICGVQAIEAAGGEVLVFSVDASDASAMKKAIAEAEVRFGTVHAAIHAAGVLDDAPLHSKELSGLERVLRPKVSGALALIEALGERQLDFVAFFSSTSVALGPAGQIDYVAANAFLNAYARQLAGQGIRARAVQWGAWREVGMAVAAVAPPPLAGSTKVAHPLLQRRAVREDGTVLFRANLSASSQWVLDQHRVRGAEPVLPGTGFVEMTRAALIAAASPAEDIAVELSDVAFIAPLAVAGKTLCTVETEVRRESGELVTVAIRSIARRGQAIEHATGRARLLPAWKPVAIDIAAIDARCTVRRQSFGPGEQLLPQERLLAFGDRWKTLRTIAFGHGEALAHLELPSTYAGELEIYALHPALLDIATGSAFSLIDGVDTDTTLIVPLSYGRIRVRGKLPRRLVSHVRIQHGSRDGVGILAATLADDQGQVVAEIDDYVVKAVDARVLKGGRKTDAASPLEKWIEHGILAEEGFDLFARVISQDRESQVLVSPLDFHSMLAELSASERPASSKPAAQATNPSPADASQGAPRDEVEQKLAAVWVELLGVDRVGLQDAFFDLGGHSLIAVRLFARIRKMWGVDLPLATLFAAPTLEALAAEVRTRLGLTLATPGSVQSDSPAVAPKSGWSPLVMIRRGGSRLPFFCVHGAGGNLLNFRDFSERLSVEQPVYGLEARGVDGQLPPSESVEEMADLYLEAVRRCQPRGPYLLGGYSGGGVVALEMARRLAADGERTNELILLDTFHPATTARVVSWRDHFDGVAKEGMPYLRRHFDATIERHFVWARKDRRLRGYLKRNATVPHELREWHLATSFLAALRLHTPPPYAGKVTLFRAQEMARAYDHMGIRLGWDEAILPNLDVVEVPGGHDSLVREPNVRLLATGLEKVLLRGSESARDRKVTVAV